MAFLAKNSGATNKLTPRTSCIPDHSYPELIATYRRAAADAAHKQGLIQAVAKKGPAAIKAAIETAAKAEKRKATFAKKLADLGVEIPD